MLQRQLSPTYKPKTAMPFLSLHNHLYNINKKTNNNLQCPTRTLIQEVNIMTRKSELTEKELQTLTKFANVFGYKLSEVIAEYLKNKNKYQ